MDNEYFNTAISLLFKVKKTQVEMLGDRGCDISNESALFTYTVADFKTQYQQIATASNRTFRAALNNFYVNSNGEYIYVYYPETVKDSKQLGKNQILDLIQELKQYTSINHVIIISELPLSGDAKKAFDGLPLYWFEHFLYGDLAYNPTKGCLVPRHELMTLEQSTTMLKENKLSINDLPIISIYDPIARYYGLRGGDMVKIYRENLAAESLVESYISYRQAVDTLLEK